MRSLSNRNPRAGWGGRVTVERHVMSDQPFQDQEDWLAHRAPANDGYSMALGRALEAFGPDLLDAPDLYGTRAQRRCPSYRRP